MRRRPSGDHVRDLRAHAPRRRAVGSGSRPTGRVRRRLPALPEQALERRGSARAARACPSGAPSRRRRAASRGSSGARAGRRRAGRRSRSSGGSRRRIRRRRGGRALQRSSYRRTVEGLMRSLGAPRGQHRAAAGVNREVVDHGLLGHLLVPVPRRRSTCPAGAARASAASISTSSSRVQTAWNARGRRRGPVSSSPRAARIVLTGADAGRRRYLQSEGVIYCVVPPELEGRAVRQARRVLRRTTRTSR